MKYKKNKMGWIFTVPFNIIQPILKSKRKHSCFCKVAFSPHISSKKLLLPQSCLLTVLILFAAAIHPNLVASREIYPQLTYCRVDLVTGGNSAKWVQQPLRKKKIITQHDLWKKKKKEDGLSLYGLMPIPIQNSRISYCIPSRPRQRWFLIKWVHLCMRYAVHHPACIILETHERF